MFPKGKRREDCVKKISLISTTDVIKHLGEQKLLTVLNMLSTVDQNSFSKRSLDSDLSDWAIASWKRPT